MGALNVIIDDELDKAFRIEIVKRIGSRRGAITMAVEQALKLWIEKVQT